MVAKLAPKFPANHLDIGSGHGDLIELMRSQFEISSSACDYTDSLMKLADVKVTVANLNNEGLPYADQSFDLVTCTEVIEHLEHYRYTLREMYRILKPSEYQNFLKKWREDNPTVKGKEAIKQGAEAWNAVKAKK